MENPTENTSRLGVNDKRHLFATLLAMSERLLMLNKFPVDMEDFALSLQPPEVEAAWRTINTARNKNTLSPSPDQTFTAHGVKWYLHTYPEDKSPSRIFMNVKDDFDIEQARRHKEVIKVWCTRQLRLEQQLLRTAKVIKAIVHSCNTVGQYKRVSPDLITFLPDKYRDALRNYTKGSPYPAITVEPEEIDTTMATLAYAALQPRHESEQQFIDRPSYYSPGAYNILPFPRSNSYQSKSVRKLEI
jgi:hypothetical protein